MASILRTPDERFRDLPDYDFEPNYLDDLEGFDGLRCHYLDLGPQNAEQTFFCVHGQPTWAYLFRHMIPVFLESGARVVVPDLFGFGRSDKPVEQSTYTFSFHRNMLLAFTSRLDLTDLTLVGQDWGGILGLTLPMEPPQRFSRLLIMNTALATGDVPLGQGFIAWRQWCRDNPDLSTGRLLGRACPHLSAEERAAYDAPFPDIEYKAGARAFPELLPEHPNADGAEISRRSKAWLQGEWQGETFMAIGMQDPVLTPSMMHHLHKSIRNCPAPFEVAEGGHFLQEWGAGVARQALQSWQR